MSKKKTNAFTDGDYVVKPQEPKTLEQIETELVEEGIVVEGGFRIEAVPVPKRAGRKAIHSFPIEKLTPGSKQSFLVTSTPEDLKKTLTRIRTFAYRNDFKVILRTENGGVRVWRAVTKS